jgi:hypothetical protein
MRELLTPFELSRRDLTRASKEQTSVLRRVRAKAAHVVKQAQALLGALKAI